MDDIAVVGIGLRFPGEASSPEELWKVLERGESQWSEFPKDRLNIDGYYHPGGDRQGSISFRGAHFLKGDFAAFDAPFFSISAEDAKAIDPQQRILLEASYEALENAGIRKEDVDGSDTAVYVGSFVKDYEQICLRDPDWQPQYAATGNGIAIMANRISHFFNLHGPSMTIDTGCSGSLVSVHLAAQSLRSGETSLAIAAGAGMILTPNTIMPMTALNFLSPDGKCFTFDARANGYGRGEGIGVVILKRLSDALRDNDTIRAVIRGTRVNQDGHTTGITLPSKEAQVANIKALYESVGLDPNHTAYVECHGTGTQAGDWRELKAISESLGATRSEDNPIVVGSVKPNIGHLEGAAGVAGLIKGVLTLEHGKIPRNINFENGNPDIDFREWKVKVPTQTLDWPLSGLRRVSVNCFGFGGTNAHVIMDEAPRYMSARDLKGNHHSLVTKDAHHATNGNVEPELEPFQPQLLCFSSHEKSGIRRIVDTHLAYLEKDREASANTFLRQYAYTLGSRRSNLEWRYSFVSKSLDDLVAKLGSCDEASFSRVSKGRAPKVCFVFSGQGAQYAQMGKDLLAFAAFRGSLESASTYMTATLGSPFDLLAEIMKGPGDSFISDPKIAQPATTALQVALVELLASFGISPKFVIGHSSGEVAAAFASGAITRETAWEVAYHRGLAAAGIPIKAPELRGGMMVVGLSLEDTEAYLESSEELAEVACINSPRSITISGTEAALAKIAIKLKEDQVFFRVLPVTTAYHSSHMRIVEEDYLTALDSIPSPDATRKASMFSSVTGDLVENIALQREYWVQNMVSPVQYVSAVQSMMDLPQEERPDIIVELSPTSALRSPTLDILSATGSSSQPHYHSVLQRKVNGEVSLLGVLGELWGRGCPVNMEKVVSRGAEQASLKCLVDLPPYPWNHSKSYWHESHLGRANRFREFPRQDLIGAPTADAISFEPRWRGFLRISENPWIQDHQVQKTIVYPAAGMISMALEGIKQLTKSENNVSGFEITNMRIDKAMIIPNTAHGLEMAMNFKVQHHQAAGKSFEFSIYSKHLDAPWEHHATGSIQSHGDRDHDDFDLYESRFNMLKAACVEEVVPRQLYELLDIVGMNYGPSFQNISEIHRGGDSCIVKVSVPDTQSKMPAKFEYPHLIHPATLDSMFQSLFAIDNKPMVPTFVGRLFVSAHVTRGSDSDFAGYSTAKRSGINDADAEIVMTQTGQSQPSVVISDLHFTGLSTPSAQEGGFIPNHRGLCSEIVWAEEVGSGKVDQLPKFLQLLAHKYPALSVLQIGGTPMFTESVLRVLAPSPDRAPWLSRFSIAEGNPDMPSPEALPMFKDTAVGNFIEMRHVDGSQPLPDYHLILNCIPVQVNAADLAKHLSTGGYVLEAVSEENQDSVSHMFEQSDSQVHSNFSVHRKAFAPSGSTAPLGAVFLMPDEPTIEIELLHLCLLQQFKTIAPSVSLSAARVGEVSANPAILDGKVVISVVDLSQPWVFNWVEKDFDLFHKMQDTAKGIVWVTAGAHMKPVNPKCAPIIALARTLVSEDPLKTIVTLDLASTTNIATDKVAENIMTVFHNSFVVNPGSAIREMEYAEENGTLYIPRLVPITALNSLVESEDSHDIQRVPFHDSNSRLKLEVVKSGLVDGALVFNATGNGAPLPNEVEVVFQHATLNEGDLETAMGRSTSSSIGHEMCGKIGRLGVNVTDFKMGDRVAAFVQNGSFQSSVNLHVDSVRKWSANIPISQVASAIHGLCSAGRVCRGKSLLIHAGASSHGLAAIELASQLGADIFTTVTGPNSAEQLETLQARGINKDHILEADPGSLVASVRRLTAGRGVDVVYNPTQACIEANLGLVRNRGIVVQFSSKSSHQSAIHLTSASTSFVTFDFSDLIDDDPMYAAELLDEACKLSQSGGYDFSIPAQLVHEAEISNLREAFALVDEHRHFGLVVVTGSPEASNLVEAATARRAKPLNEAVLPDKTYVLAGGLGGLGRSICGLLVGNGARHIAFLSRSGASTDAARRFVESLQLQEVDARVFQVDICDEQALRDVVGTQIVAQMPAVEGVFQCAAVIRDAVFDNMTFADWQVATRPKTVGSSNLVDVVSSTASDAFFVFLASSAGVIGNRGQANYAAGNCFEDAMARKFQLQGRRAVSIDLGPVLGAGMLADDDEILDMLRASGFYGIRHQDFLTMVTHAITGETLPGVRTPPQIIMGIGTGGLMLQNEPADPYWSRTALYQYMGLVDLPPPDLSAINGAAKLDMKAMLACCADPDSAAAIVCTGLAHMLAKAMNMLAEEIDTGKPPNVYGVDSLVAVGVRNWVVHNCGVEISVFEVLSDKTVAELAGQIARKGGFGADRA